MPPWRLARPLARLAVAPAAVAGGATFVRAGEEETAGQVGQLRRDGFVVLRAKAPRAALLDEVRTSVLAQLASEQRTAAFTLRRVVSVVNKPSARYEVLLPDDGGTAVLLRELLHEHAAFYAAALRADAPGPAATAETAETAALVELGAIVSTGGARRQDVHTDIPYAEGTRLYTTFVALQDVEEDMGPTLMFSGSHTGAFHAAKLTPSLACRAVRALPRALDLLLPSWVDLDGVCNAQYANLPAPTRMTLRRGDAVVMDTRLHHCGGANRSAPGAPPRVLLQFSLLAPSASTGRAELKTAYTNVTDELYGHEGESLPTFGVLLCSNTQNDYLDVDN